MKMMFDNERDARNRLMNTIITYKDRPAWVIDITHTLGIRGRFMVDGEEFICSQTSKNLKLSPPRLGFMNLGDKALYLRRIPHRRWKAGLDSQAIYGAPPRFMVQGLMNEVGGPLAMCLEGKYPTYQEVLEVAAKKRGNPFELDGPIGRAFSRDFAVIGGNLDYKGTNVGQVQRNGVAILEPRYTYLAEALEEAIHG